MNQYGILGRYIPAFGRIVGQMQHDLFHVYTVDEHILMVVRNLRRFAVPEFAHEFPLVQQIDRANSPAPKCCMSPDCSTTSPRDAAATIRNWARRMPALSASSTSSAVTTPIWWYGWSSII